MANTLDAGVPNVSEDLSDVYGDLDDYSTSFVDELLNSVVPCGDPCVKFSIVPSKKSRGLPYIANKMENQGNILTAKKNVPVRAKLTSCPRSTVLISLRYEEEEYENEVVECSSCPHNYRSCSKLPHHKANFCISSPKCEFDYMQQPDGHHAARFIILEETPEINFHIVFKCWNSCSSHGQFGKKRNMLIQVLDECGMYLLNEVWSVRVCASVKRDHSLSEQQPKDVHTQPAKRPAVDITVASLSKIKKEKEEQVVHCINADPLPTNDETKLVNWSQQHMPALIESNECVYNTVPSNVGKKSVASAGEDSSAALIVMMKNEKQMQLVKDMVTEMGGSYRCCSLISPAN